MILRSRLGKKGVGEGISWAAGLIVIVLIIFVSIIAYRVGHTANRSVAEVVRGENGISVILSDAKNDAYDAMNSQRLGAAFFVSDFDSNLRGELLRKMFSYLSTTPSFQTPADSFSSMISYDYFGFAKDESTIVFKYKKGVKNADKCNQRNKEGSFFLREAYVFSVNKYVPVSITARGCEHE